MVIQPNSTRFDGEQFTVKEFLQEEGGGISIQPLLLLFAGHLAAAAFLPDQGLLRRKAGKTFIHIKDGNHQLHRQASPPFCRFPGGGTRRPIFHVQRQSDYHPFDPFAGDQGKDRLDRLGGISDLEHFQRCGKMPPGIADGQSDAACAQINPEGSHIQ